VTWWSSSLRGPYHRQVETVLSERGIPFVKVNPRQARRFAEAIGKLAKTDRVDAAMLAKMGAVLSLEAAIPCDRKIYVLRNLLVARRALVKDQTAARSRLKTCMQPHSQASDCCADETEPAATSP
jgi:transposase